MRRIGITLLLVAKLVAASAAQLDQAFQTHDDFTIHLPAGWVEVPRTEIEKHFAEIYGQYPSVPRVHFDYAYQLASSEHWFVYPYIMIEVRHTGKLTLPPEKIFTEMKSQFVGNLKQEYDKTVGEMKGSIPIIESVLLDDGLVDVDIPNRVMWMVQRSRLVDIGSVVSVIGVCLTETGTIRVGLVVKESDFAAYLPTFRQIVNSIQYGPTLQYQPIQHPLPMKRGEKRPRGTAWVLDTIVTSMMKWLIPSLIIFFFFALVGVAIAGIRRVFGTKSKKE